MGSPDLLFRNAGSMKMWLPSKQVSPRLGTIAVTLSGQMDDAKYES
jgi:hypothetical protein